MEALSPPILLLLHPPQRKCAKCLVVVRWAGGIVALLYMGCKHVVSWFLMLYTHTPKGLFKSKRRLFRKSRTFCIYT